MNLMLNHYLDFIKNEKNENFDEIETQGFIKNLTSDYSKLIFTKNENNNTLIRKNQISRAIINILDNANKFAENIYMKSYVLEKKWIIIIEDDGPGTSLSQEQLVKPFTKGSEQLNQGTGLGLSIVKKLVKLNNGELRFEESSYGGLKVVISLEIKN